MLRGYSADRLCLDLRRGAVRRDLRAGGAADASGCFAPGQPVTLQRLPHGDYELDASLRAGPADATLANATRVHFAVAPEASADDAPAFSPSYEWQQVLPQQGVPAGLEVHRSVAGSGDRRARIPDPWRLQLYLGRARGFLRLDVGRRTRVREVEAAAAQASSHVQPPPPSRLQRAAARRRRRPRPEQTAEGCPLLEEREARGGEARGGGHVDVGRRIAAPRPRQRGEPFRPPRARRTAAVFLLAPPRGQIGQRATL